MMWVVGIFSRENDRCYRFLTDALRSKDREVRTFIITNNGFQEFREEVSRCHCAILYHSKTRGRLNITDVTDSLYDEEVRYLSETLGKKNVVVVADDLDNSSWEVKMRILQSQPLIKGMAADLVLFSNADKNSQDALTEKLQKLSHILIRENHEGIPNVPMVVGPVQLFYQMVVLCILRICKTRIQCVMNILTMMRVVGIFSREDDRSYRFLTDALRSKDREVRTFIITNHGFQEFREEVSRCHCAILYHSKTRGRLNITDVTDSLYDEEVIYLSETLGKKNVVVVADDLDNSSSEVKMRILQSQPLIEGMAADLVLFTNADKNSQDALTEKLQNLSHILIRENHEGIPNVPMVDGPVQRICKTGIQFFMSVVVLICNWIVQLVMIW